MFIKAKEKKERALGVKLFLKAHRCSSPKCAMIRRPSRPGIHGKKRRRGQLSEFGQQLLEKQKIRASYGLKESQIVKVFKEASKMESMILAVIKILESRFDNVIFRSGFAPSRIVARQYITHGHFLINGKKVNIPSYKLKVGDVISIKPLSKELLIFKDLPNIIKKHEATDWISIDADKLESKIKKMPTEIPDQMFNINLVVDYYSR